MQRNYQIFLKRWFSILQAIQVGSLHNFPKPYDQKSFLAGLKAALAKQEDLYRPVIFALPDFINSILYPSS
jgi:hypothetical protein